MSSSGGSRGRPSKVARLIDRHGLTGLGEELAHLWTTDDEEERLSLRDLAAYFNRQILEQRLDDAGMETLDGEVTNIYRLLTDDDASPADRTRIEGRLEREGVDVDTLRSEFVSYQAIRTYLQEHQDAEYTNESPDRVEAALESIRRLRSRTASVTESKIEQLRAMDDAELGDVHVSVDIRAFCEECDSQYDVDTLFEQRGCDCS